MILKFLEKLYQGHCGFTVIFLFKDSINFSLKTHAFFLLYKFLRNFNQRQYGLTYIVNLEDIDQCLSKAHIGNPDQDKIQFESNCPFKDST